MSSKRVDPVVAAMEKMERQRQPRRNKAEKFRRDRLARLCTPLPCTLRADQVASEEMLTEPAPVCAAPRLCTPLTTISKLLCQSNNPIAGPDGRPTPAMGFEPFLHGMSALRKAGEHWRFL